MNRKIYILREDAIRKRVCHVVMNVGLKSRRLIEVEFRPFVKKRTTNQNSMMHLVWRQFGNELGWDEEEVKEFFKDKYGSKIERQIDDEVVWFPKPSHKYSVEVAAQMIDTVQRVAAEHGIMLPEIHHD